MRTLVFAGLAQPFTSKSMRLEVLLKKEKKLMPITLNLSKILGSIVHKQFNEITVSIGSETTDTI